MNTNKPRIFRVTEAMPQRPVSSADQSVVGEPADALKTAHSTARLRTWQEPAGPRLSGRPTEDADISLTPQQEAPKAMALPRAAGRLLPLLEMTPWRSPSFSYSS